MHLGYVHIKQSLQDFTQNQARCTESGYLSYSGTKQAEPGHVGGATNSADHRSVKESQRCFD